MSGIYFCFSDECGDYKQVMSEKQLKQHPFYIRTTLLMNAMEWKSLNFNFRKLKVDFSIPHNEEVKWSHLWMLYKLKDQKSLPEKFNGTYLSRISFNNLLKFVESSLSLINGLKEKKIIATFTTNQSNRSESESLILIYHLQEHMQRIQMELQADDENLGILFFDPVNDVKNELFRRAYHQLFRQGDYIDDYKSIKDSLNIENSHHSVGIQLSDYITGAFSAFLKSTDKKNYQDGINLFYRYIYPNLRTHWNGKIAGYGIREVPSDKMQRNWFNEKLNSLKP